MDIKTARQAIEAILAAIPDEALPAFDKVDYNKDGKPTVWWGGAGRVLGSARRNGVRDPLIYRRDASWSAIEHEMAHRADRCLLDNGDNPDGIKFTSQGRSSTPRRNEVLEP
ncbi:hypothetical protein BKG71_03680 [Mycobacteroides chelonae]|nr:hypothetical protein [Mycobacteroides chelonae]OHT53420.1 hypothetical protein BKG63_10935 [Mycobacteroides chelonae]OHU05142.1 hypothetical protein BKG71_03680 [Mycobacteroides chelonae]